jgi:membrane-associated protein
VSLSTDGLLTAILVYGYPVLFGIVLAGSLGVPIPTDLMLLAAGGFVASGDLDLVTVLLLVFVAAVAGDCVVFLVARWLGHEAVTRHGARFGLGAERLAHAQTRLGAWVGAGVFLTRCLLTPLSLPTTVLAAVGRYPFGVFALIAAFGEAVWTAAYVGVGYLFGESWSALGDWISDKAGLIGGLCLAGVALAALVWLVRSREDGAPVQSPG